MAEICLDEPSAHCSFLPLKHGSILSPHSTLHPPACYRRVKHLLGPPGTGRGSFLGEGPRTRWGLSVFPWKTRPLTCQELPGLSPPRGDRSTAPISPGGRSSGRNYIKISKNEVPHFTHPCNPWFSSCFMDERLKEEKPTLLKWESDEVSFFLGSESCSIPLMKMYRTC